jgi:hypothetical protein
MERTMYLVSTSRHAWGAGKTLTEALANAQLRTPTPEYFFELELLRYTPYGGPDQPGVPAAEIMQQGYDDWQYAEEDWYDDDDRPVEVVITVIDSGVWSDWEIDPVDGGHRLYPTDDAREVYTSGELKKVLRDAQVKCIWRKGVLEPVGGNDADQQG